MNPTYFIGVTVVGSVYVFNRVVLDCGGMFPTFSCLMCLMYLL